MLSVLKSIFIHKPYVQTSKASILETSLKHCMNTAAMIIAHKEAAVSICPPVSKPCCISSWLQKLG
jgi:hypothetical protein